MTSPVTALQTSTTSRTVVEQARAVEISPDVINLLGLSTKLETNSYRQ